MSLPNNKQLMSFTGHDASGHSPLTDISSIVFFYNLIEVSDLERRAENLSVQNATSNEGDASRVGKKCSYYLVEFVSFLFIIPTRDASPPLVPAFGACVFLQRVSDNSKCPNSASLLEPILNARAFSPLLLN